MEEAAISGDDERRNSGHEAGPSHSEHSTSMPGVPKPAWFQGCRVQVTALLLPQLELSPLFGKKLGFERLPELPVCWRLQWMFARGLNALPNHDDATDKASWE